MVTPQGKVLFTGARTVKSVAGYDITRLMVGSEGTLGLITSAILRLVPLPQARKAVSAGFPDLRTASEAVSRLIGSGLLPSKLEVMDGACTRAVSGYIKEDLGDAVLLLAEFDGMRSVCDENAERAARLLRVEFGADVRTEACPEGRERLWRARRAVLPALTRLRPTTLLEDVTVPRSKLPAMAAEIAKAAAKHNVQVVVFGHAGDGNLHPTFLTDSKDTEEMARVKSAIGEVMQACVDLEGTVSGEHGVGLDEKPYLRLEIGQSGYEVMKSLKDSLDPKGIMNPGKMFYED
jgi:glycolate oxidase